MADEKLANVQLERAKLLYEKGAFSLNDYQTAEDVENKAQVEVETAAEHLRVLGSPLDHPSGIVDIYAPVSGVITDQQVTNAAGVAGLGVAESIHDLRPELRVDSMRRLRERSCHRARRGDGGDSLERVSRQGIPRRTSAILDRFSIPTYERQKCESKSQIPGR